MAASAWTVFNQAKHNLGLGNIDLSGDTFNMTLFRTSASANLISNISTYASIGSFTSTAGGGDDTTALASLVWTGTASANANVRKWDVADPVFTASTQAISQVRYAVIYTSGASAGASKLLCYAALSTAQFVVSSSNTLTVQMAAGGVFTLT
jgi:hypothetical protein